MVDPEDEVLGGQRRDRHRVAHVVQGRKELLLLRLVGEVPHEIHCPLNHSTVQFYRDVQKNVG